jgi:hypothetical protein
LKKLFFFLVFISLFAIFTEIVISAPRSKLKTIVPNEPVTLLFDNSCIQYFEIRRTPAGMNYILYQVKDSEMQMIELQNNTEYHVTWSK